MVKRIFVLSHNSMFGKGIEALLAQKTGVELVGSDAYDETVVDCILKYSPDTIIVNCDDPDRGLTDAVLCMVQKRLDTCVIGLSLQENQISVYRGEQKQVRQLEDLLEAILG